MDKYKIRKECERLFSCKTIEDSFELLDIYIELFFQIVNNQDKYPEKSDADRDAKIVMQMMFTKIVYLRKLIEGINYNAKDGSTLNTIMDPTIIASFIRNVYETVCMFNLIYKNSKTEDEKLILYNLWVHAGLKYRQRFEEYATTNVNKEKVKNEQGIVEELIKEIETTKLYKNLSEKDQRKIQRKIKDKDYKINFKNNEVEFLSWQEIVPIMGVKNNLFDSIYTYFSLYSHPSNVAVFQFSDMFKKDKEDFLRLTNSNLMNCFILLGMFTADYIYSYPETLKIFESFSIRDQVVVDFHNTKMRGEEYSINKPWKSLE